MTETTSRGKTGYSTKGVLLSEKVRGQELSCAERGGGGGLRQFGTGTGGMSEVVGDSGWRRRRPNRPIRRRSAGRRLIPSN